MSKQTRFASARFSRAAALRPLVCILPLLTLACATRTPAETAASTHLRVITTTDFHGRLLPERPSFARGEQVGGAAALASYFDRARAAATGAVLLVDAGDIMQGTPISNLTEGRSTIAYYDAVRYDAAAIGNHEFDWSIPVLEQRIADADFPWLAANILVAGSDTAPSFATPAVLLERAGVRIGIIGLITERTPATTIARHVSSLQFTDGAAAIDRYVPWLRAQGADFVIVVAHEGGYCDPAPAACRGTIVDWANGVSERPDLIVAGHAHSVMNTRVNDIPIVEAGSYGYSFGIVDLVRRDDSVTVISQNVHTAYTDSVPAQPRIASLVAGYVTEIGPQVNRVIATLAEALPTGRVNEHALGRLIADAQRATAGTQLALMNNGGIRAGLDSGPVTWGELYSLHPFGNTLVRMRITGAQVREMLEHTVAGATPIAHLSGLVAEWDPARAAGSRVGTITLQDGTPVRDDEHYTIVVNSFLATGAGDGYAVFGAAENLGEVGITDLDALIEYFGKQPQPLRAPSNPRLIRLGEAR